METSFRAVFEAEDRSFSEGMRRMQSESRILADMMIHDAVEVAAATKQNVNKVLSEQIALYEKRRELTKTQERMQLDARYSAAMSSAPDDKSRDRTKQSWDNARSSLEAEFKRDDLQSQLLRELIETVKESASKQIVADKETVRENVKRVEEGRTEGMSDADIYTARIQKGMLPDEQADKKDKEKTWLEVAKGTLAGNIAMKALQSASTAVTNVMTAGSGEQALPSIFEAIPPEFGGHLLASVAEKHVDLAQQRDVIANKLRARGVNIDMAALDEGGMSSGLLDAFSNAADKRSENASKAAGAVQADAFKRYTSGEIDAAAYKREMENAKYAAEETAEFGAPPTAKTRKALGSAPLPQDAVDINPKVSRYKETWSYEKAGVDEIEFQKKAFELMRSLGTAKNLVSQTKAMIDITQGGGLDENTAMGIANLIKERGGSGDLRKTAGMVVGALDSSGVSRAYRNEAVQDVTALTQSRYDQGFATSDPVAMAKIKGAFYKNYGYALSSTSNIEGVMGAMANPKDEFQQGLNYKIYSEQRAKENKATSYVDFMKWQEKPENGLMSGKMDYLKGVYGEGDWGQMAFKTAGIGKTWEAAAGYISGGTEGLSPEEIAKQTKMGTGMGVGSAKNYTTTMQKQQAELTDQFIKSATDGVATAITQMGESLAEKIASTNFPGASIFSNYVKEIVNKAKTTK